MKYLFVLTLNILWLFCNAQQIAIIDVLHYNFYIAINNNNDTIIGQTKIICSVNKAGNIVLNFNAVKEANKKGMLINTLTVNNINTNFSIEAEKIIINTIAKANTTLTIYIAYSGIPANGLIISKNKFGDRTFFGDNWPNRAHYWLPCIDDIGDKATVDFTVNAPIDYTVVSNGSLTSTDTLNNQVITKYTTKVPLATKVIVFGAAKFAMQKAGEVNGIPVISYIYQKDSTAGFKDYSKAVPILQWFINNVGTYNYTKLANVQSTTMFGGMENASAIFYNEAEISGTYSNEDLLAHEIAHQWFGNTVTEKSFEHLWLSEGFATYFASLYIKHTYGNTVFMQRMLKEKQQVYNANVNGPIVNNTSNYMSLLNAYSYQKGAWVLFMLHNQVGDTAFFNFIKAYYKKYRNANVNTDDFLNEIKTSFGEKMVLFLKQYLYQKENPLLHITLNINTKFKTNNILNVLQKTNYTFTLPIKITFEIGNEKKSTVLNLNKKSQNFILPAGINIKSIKVNTDNQLLLNYQLN